MSEANPGAAANCDAAAANTPLAAKLQIAAQALGLAPSAAQSRVLLQYLALLSKWNVTYNLTAIHEPDKMLTFHLADCLALVGPLQRHLADHPAASTLLDVGSGGGLPGVVLATMLPALQVTCLDSVGKKAAFVQQVAAETGLRNLRAQHSRAERPSPTRFDIVTSRAFSSLADLASLTRDRLAPDGVWVAMKGRVAPDELRAANEHARVFHVEQLNVPGLHAERCLVWMRQKVPSAVVSPR